MNIFSKLRERFWPVHGPEETKKFLGMSAMMALALFGYTSLRITKDALIMTSPGAGAAVLNFLKGYIVMPMSILFVVYYGLMSNRVSKKNLFYVALIPFLLFFVFFAAVLYPLADIIHISPERLAALQEAYPRFQYLVPIFGYWSFSLFYVFAELWGNVSITLLFWQFANFKCTKDEVKRFYPLFGAYSNIGLITAGFIQTLKVTTELTCVMVMTAATAMAGIYWWLNKDTEDFESHSHVEKNNGKSKKVKLSFSESIKLIFSSKYLGLIALVVLCYGIAVNLAEVTWKAKVKELYPNKQDLQAFMGQFFFMTGIVTLLFGLFVKNVVARFGWLFAALITPIVLITTSLGFFGFALYSDYLLAYFSIAASSGVLISVIIGAIQNIAGKSTKYALFDPTTQMAYIPLEDDLRVKGKAAVDVIGGRWGKSLGGHIQSAALIITGGSQLSIAPALMIIGFLVCLVWIFATKKLYNEYKTLSEQEGK